MARYLGPEDFGTLNYVISVTTILLSLSSFGTNEQVLTNLVTTPKQIEDILNTTFYLRLLAGASTLFVFIAYLLLSKSSYLLYFYVTSIALLMQAFDVIDLYYRAKVQVKYSASSRLIQLILSSILKVYFIWIKADVKYFIYLFAVDAVTYALFIFFIYSKQQNSNFIFLKPQVKKILSLAKQCFPLMAISTLSSLLIRIDQIVISHFLDDRSLGIYSSSIRILEITTIFPTIILMSLFTALLNAKKVSETLYESRMKNLGQMLFWGSLVVAIMISLFSEKIVYILFGDKYLEASQTLTVLIFNIIFMSISQISFRWYITENLNYILLAKYISGVILNFVLNIVLIPHHGIMGAAFSSIISNFFMNYIFDLFSSKTRKYFYINISFITLPFQTILRKIY